MLRTKVLFVVAGFYRAGAERFAYETDQSLNKDEFSVTILVLEKQAEISTVWKERYYEARHKELGTEIVYIDRFINDQFDQQGRIRNKIKKRLHLFPKNPKKYTEELLYFLDSFEVIHWMGEYIYMVDLPEYIRKKTLIHMMTARFQKRTLYDHFDHEAEYQFCTPFYKEELSYELEQFQKYHAVYVPLFLLIEEEKPAWKYNDRKVKKIGIFTRLSSFKPLDPFFYAFHLLLDQHPNLELHIFGSGDPVREGLVDILQRINLTEKVFFRGHTDDILKTCIEEELSLTWFQGYNNDRPAGYAGLEIGLSGTPLLCWDFYPASIVVYNSTFPHYKNLRGFAEKTLEILYDKHAAEALSELQFQYVVNERDVKNHIQTVEREYSRIAVKSRL